MRSDEDPAPSEQEQDANPDRVEESEAMSGAGHEAPEQVEKAE